MNMMRKSIKVIVGLVIAIPVVCLLLGSDFKDNPSMEAKPESDYQEATILKSKAEEYIKMRQWESAIEEYKLTLDKLQVIKQKFPEWETSTVAEEYLACQERIGLLEATVLSNSALGYYEKRKYDDAFMAYTQIVEKYGEKYKNYPLVPAAWSHLGHIYRFRGRYEEALKAYNIVLSKYQGPRYQNLITNSQVGMAFVYQAMGKYDEAEKLFQKAMAGDPSFAANFQIILKVLPVKAWGELGSALPIIQEFISTVMPEGEFRRSVIQVNSGLENDTFAFIGLKYQMEGRMDEAKKYYQKCIDTSLNKESIGYKLATVALRRLEERTK